MHVNTNKDAAHNLTRFLSQKNKSRKKTLFSELGRSVYGTSVPSILGSTPGTVFPSTRMFPASNNWALNYLFLNSLQTQMTFKKTIFSSFF